MSIEKLLDEALQSLVLSEIAEPEPAPVARSTRREIVKHVIRCPKTGRILRVEESHRDIQEPEPTHGVASRFEQNMRKRDGSREVVKRDDGLPPVERIATYKRGAPTPDDDVSLEDLQDVHASPAEIAKRKAVR